MDTRLESFLLLCELLHYHAAAEQLHITQPALTKQIQSLEREFGAKLFTYEGRVLRKTEAGAKVEAYAKALQYNYRELCQQLAKPQVRELRIGASKTIGEYVLRPQVLQYLRQPQHRLELVIENTEQLLHKLDHNQLDFLVLEGIFPKENYAYEHWRQEEFIGICQQDSPLCGCTLELEELFNQRLLLRERGSGTRRLLEAELDNQGYTIANFAHTSSLSSFTLITEAVAQGLGISFVYAAVAQQAQEQLSSFRVRSFRPSHEFNLVYLKNTNVKPLMQEFFTTI